MLRRCSHAGLVLVIGFCIACDVSIPFKPGTSEVPRPGLVWILFQSPNFERTQEIGVDPRVEVDTGTSVRDYSKLWIGMLRSPTDEAIDLYTEADNGCRFFLDGRLLIDAWSNPGANRATISAKKNSYLPFRLEYFQDGGTGHMRLFWSWEGQPRELIPASAFFHSASQQQEIMAIAQKKQIARMPPARENRSEIYLPVSGEKPPSAGPQEPVPARPGPHLFLDDYLIASASNIIRRVVQPGRDQAIPNPLVTGPEDRNFQPFFTVSRSPETGRYRIWYGAWKEDRRENRSTLAYMESDDGIRWIRPPVLCRTPEIQFGSEVIDRGPDWGDRAERYVYGYWHEGGLRVAVSPDGIGWRPLVDQVVLPHDHDITNIWWDPIRRH